MVLSQAERQSRVVQLMDENRDCAKMIQDYHEEVGFSLFRADLQSYTMAYSRIKQ